MRKKAFVVAVLAVSLMVGSVSFAAGNFCLNLRKEGPYVAHPGDVITFTLTATNCGDEYLGSSVGLYDPLVYVPGTDYIPDTRFTEQQDLVWGQDLAVGQSFVKTFDYLVTTNDCGVLVNNAWVMSPYDLSYGYIDTRADASWSVRVDCTFPGAGTPGYWKNHPEAWPVEEITIGGITYPKSVAIEYLSSRIRTDKSINMFKALVSAKLNVLIGNPSACIDTIITAADTWMAAHPVNSLVDAGSLTWQDIEPKYTALDNYNNGMLCAPSRD